MLLAPILALGQVNNSRIAGRVLNEKNGEVLAGATVEIVGQNKRTVTDQNGRFSLSGLPAGTYKLRISFVGYSTKEVEEIVVPANGVADVNAALALRTEGQLQDVVVRSKASRESLNSLLITQKNAAIVSDGIPAELIRKTPDRNTSDVLKRISGASIQEDKFAVIRGLNDRYNAAFLNGAPLPSSESDRKAFAFDIFPSNMLENLVISKTATPEQSGEFGGGIVNIVTNSIPSKNFTSISLSAGYNTITTFKNGADYRGGNTDWLGLDDGTRAIPKGVPTGAGFPSNGAARADLARLFTNDWGLTTRRLAPNYSFQFSKGINFQRKGEEFAGMLLSLTYNRSFNQFSGVLRSYEYARTGAIQAPILRGDFSDQTTAENVLVGLVANFSMKLNNNNKFGFKNILSINSDDRIITRAGQADVSGDPEFLSKASVRWFTSNVIYSGQLNGEHNLKTAKVKINWLGSLSKVSRNIPNLRQLNYGLAGGTDVYTAGIPAGTTSFENAGSMFFSTTDESIFSGKLDIARNFDFSKTFTNQVKLGVYYQERDRQFDGRLLGFGRFQNAGGGATFDFNLLSLPESEIFAPANMGVMANGRAGFLLLDGTRPTYVYDATSKLTAGYLMVDSRIAKSLRAVYGVRAERFNQLLNTFANFNVPLNLNTTKTDLLPSINLIYSINNKQNLRASYSTTLNRPEFRELAPFPFFDFATRYLINGNADLVRAVIQNVDVRYEIFPGRGQLLSASGFYKKFKNPIELASDPNNDRAALYQNAESATSYGVELEFRTLLSSLLGATEDGVLSRFTLASNAAFIWSEVRVPEGLGGLKGQIQNRQLQGQSPYVFNASASYADDTHGWSATLSANRVGQRIFVVGNVNDPDTWEQGRTLLDFQLAKTVWRKKLELKLNAKDLLRQQQVFFLDLNENLKYDKNSDLTFQSRVFGTTISVSASLRL